MYAYSSFHGPSPHGMPCSYGAYGYTSMSQGTYGYNDHDNDAYGRPLAACQAANVSEEVESAAEQLEFHPIWSQMNMLDDVKRWMTPDGTAYGNARAEYWRSWNALGLRWKKAAESDAQGSYQHKPAQSSGAQSSGAQSSGAQSSGVSKIKPAAGGSKLRPEEVLYQIQPGCSAPEATHIPATMLRQNAKVGWDTGGLTCVLVDSWTSRSREAPARHY